MTMHSLLLKEHERIITNPNSHVSGSGITTQFTFFPVSHSGNLKASDKREKSSNLFEAYSKQSTISLDYQGRIGFGYGQSLVCGKYDFADPCYGILSTYGPQHTGRIMLPLDMTADEGPIYVNAKQYHGIIRRRISRAKAEALNKARKVRKPYMHQSRHLHAMRRPRGCGGRFLNTKTSNKTETKKTGSSNFSLSIDSQNSEVIQSENGNSKFLNENNGKKLNLLGTEVTSIFSSANIDHFSNNHLRSFIHPLSDMMSTGHGFSMSSNWV